MVNIIDLQEKRKIRAERNHELYKGFFIEISEKIKNRDQMGHRNMVHRIPTIIFGFPMFNVNHAIQYVIMKLQHNGFFACIWHGNYLYIDWSIVQKKSSNKCQKLKKPFTMEELDDKIRKIQ